MAQDKQEAVCDFCGQPIPDFGNNAVGCNGCNTVLWRVCDRCFDAIRSKGGGAQDAYTRYRVLRLNHDIKYHESREPC